MKLKCDSNYVTEVSYTKFQQNLAQASKRYMQKFSYAHKQRGLYNKFKLMKVKVKFSPYMPWRHIEGMKVQFHSFWTSAQDVCKWSASHPDQFTPGKRAPGIQRIRDGVGPRADVKRFGYEIYFPCQDLNLRSSSQKPSHYSDYNNPASLKSMYLCNNCVFYQVSW